MYEKQKKVIFTEKGAVTGAPYSQAIAFGELLFVSGQGPVEPKTGKIVYGDIQEQVKLTLENLKSILEAGDSSLNNVLKVTVFLANMDDFESMNGVYKEYFKESRPARSCIQAGRLPFDIKIEIDAIAHIPKAE
ncbi:MAG: Rid family detoxifying hydrolase [Nitrospirota bacterium]